MTMYLVWEATGRLIRVIDVRDPCMLDFIIDEFDVVPRSAAPESIIRHRRGADANIDEVMQPIMSRVNASSSSSSSAPASTSSDTKDLLERIQNARDDAAVVAIVQRQLQRWGYGIKEYSEAACAARKRKLSCLGPLNQR